MTLQTNVFNKQALGVVGEMADASPARVNSHVLLADSVIGTAVTAGTDGVNKGGAGAFEGIIVNPKTLALQGGLSPNLIVKANTQIEACTFGRLYVAPTTATAVGNAAFYDTTTGEIKAGASGATIAGAKEIVGSKFLTAGNANDVCVLQLTTTA